MLCCSDEQNEDCREALFHQRNGYVGLCEIRLAPSEPSCPGRTPTSGANSRSTVVGFDSRIGATGGWRTAWCLVPLTAASSCAQGVEAWLRVPGQTKQRFWDAGQACLRHRAHTTPEDALDAPARRRIELIVKWSQRGGPAPRL